MDALQALVLGALQGITEWLPISSSGQVMLSLVNFLQANPEAAFSLAIILHFGTLLAVVVKYRVELARLLLNLSWKDPLLRFLIISTIVTGIVGIPLYFALKGLFSYAQGGLANGLVGALLIVTGIALYVSRGKLGSKEMKNVGWLETGIAGAAQGLAILPGISRSGVTVAAMLLAGIRQELALKLSFLMSIPAVLGALALDYAAGDIASAGFGIWEIAAGVLAAFVFGYLTIDILLGIARKVRFDLFCILFGLIALSVFLL